MPAKKVYNTQCARGHVDTAPRGSIIEQRAKEREAKSFLDAISISAEECDQCTQDDAAAGRDRDPIFD